MHFIFNTVKIKLMEKFWCFIIALVIILTLQTSPANASLQCAPLKNKLRQIISVEGMSFIAEGELGNNLLILIFQDQKGNFKIIGVSSDKTACEILSAHDLRTPEEKEF